MCTHVMAPPSHFRASSIIRSHVGLELMSPCKNLCERLAYPCYAFPSPYFLGLKYCTRCSRYFETRSTRCPCCNRSLRHKPRNKSKRQQDHNQILTKSQIISCDICSKEAFIFQEEGNFCLNCWQERTEPRITAKDAR